MLKNKIEKKNSVGLIDTHCHLNFRDFKDDADEVITRTLEAGVWLVNVGAQYSTSRRAVEYAEKYARSGSDGVWAAIGLHPVHLFDRVGEEDKDLPRKISREEFNYDKYLELAANDRVVAIGEVGLDYHHFDCDQKTDFQICRREVKEIIERQKKVFREFIKLAGEVNKPLIIHSWNADKKDKELVDGAVAYEDILEIIHSLQFPVSGDGENKKAYNSQNVDQNNSSERKSDAGDTLNSDLQTGECKPRIRPRGVIHSFIGNYKMAQKFIQEGFLIGLNGIITYSDSYNRLVREIGLENIILETDAPYLTPAPLERYRRNEPLNILWVARKIAAILDVSLETVAQQTTANARRLFRI